MSRGRRWRVVEGIGCVAVLFAGTFAARALELAGLPARDAPLHARIDAFDALVHANHWNEGQYLPCVIFPPAGEDRPVTGNHEDVAGHTAFYLAACSHKYAVTQDPEVRKLADEVMGTILRLEEVTGVPGVCARGFYRTDRPLWHEQAFFFPLEWHGSDTMDGYRWMGDLSSDKFVNFIYGVGVYWEICADEAHKAIAANFIDRFVGRCVENNFKLVDVDGKMTLWGNFCPDLPHENLNALEMLAGLKVAHKLTGKETFAAAYKRLIAKYHYDDQAILAKVLWPDEHKVPWDDHLAAQSLYMLMRWEEDADLLRKYRMALNRCRCDWKKPGYRGGDDVWYAMLYQVLTGEEVVDDACRETIKNTWAVSRDRRSFTIPGPNGSETVEADVEEIPSEVFRTYWFGRQFGFIDASW